MRCVFIVDQSRRVLFFFLYIYIERQCETGRRCGRASWRQWEVVNEQNTANVRWEISREERLKNVAPCVVVVVFVFVVN